MLFVRTMFVGAICGLFATSVFAQTYDEVREAQTLLYQADYNPGPIDGEWGRRTEGALVAFLQDNRLEYDGELSQNELSLLREAPVGDRFRSIQYTSYGRAISSNTNDFGITVFDGFELPQFLNPTPNDRTLEHYFFRWLGESRGLRSGFKVDGSEAPRSLSFNSVPNGYLGHELRYSSMLSYLMYDDGAVIYDDIAPSNRFPNLTISEDTPFRSQSVGKSLVSYLVGHAICAGYIDGLSTTLEDWPMVKNTVYETAQLLDVLNMSARDQDVVNDNGFPSSGRFYNTWRVGIQDFAQNELAGSRPSSYQTYNYNGLSTNIALNYMFYRLGDEWDQFIASVLQDHIGFEDEFTLMNSDFRPPFEGKNLYMFYATRHDYLRWAITMHEDWQANGCVGQYLRDIYNSRVPKNQRSSRDRTIWNDAQSYGGQFHLDFAGMEDRILFGMEGYGGQNVVVDMETGRIVVTNSVHTNIDWRTLVYEAMRTGTLPDQHPSR